MDGGCCFKAKDGIRDLVRSRGLGDVYKRQQQVRAIDADPMNRDLEVLAADVHADGLVAAAQEPLGRPRIPRAHIEHHAASGLSLIHI